MPYLRILIRLTFIAIFVGSLFPLIRAEIGIRGGRLVVAQSAGPRGFNRLILNDQDTAAVCNLLMASLVAINQNDHRVEPALAERWTLSRDHRVLTLYLRKQVSFSDGHPFTADDVVFTFTVALDDRIPSVARSLLSFDGQKVLVEKIDAHTVRIKYPRTLGVAERLLDGICILPRHILETHYKNGTLVTAWNLTAAPPSVVGLGPFRLKQYVAGQRTVLERNPYYWKKDAKGQTLPYLDQLVFEIIPDRNTQQLKFQQGELDVLKPLLGPEVAALRQHDRKGAIKIYNIGPSLINDVLWFNQNDARDPKTGKPRVEPYRRRWFQTLAFRQAVSHAIDRQSIIDLVFGGQASLSYGPITPGNRHWYNPHIPSYPYDLQKARLLLSHSGFTYKQGQLYDSEGRLVEFVLHTNAGNAIRQKIIAMIQQDLAKLGIKVIPAPLETRALLNKIEETYDYEACLLSLLSGDLDPSAEMNVLLSKGPTHWWHPQQAQPVTAWESRIDALMVEQMHATDPQVRKRLFEEVQTIMAEQQAFIYLTARHLIVAARSNLANVKPGVLNDFVLWNAEELFWKR